jgi:5'-nucleotidase / UDP-sugar diphosphatase
MKRIKSLRTLSMLVVFAIFTASGQEVTRNAPQMQQHQTITILHTNDFHGNYMPFLTTTGSATSQTGDQKRDTLITFDKEAKIGGLAVLATAVKEIRSSKGNKNVLLLDSGDTFSDDLLGNLTKGEAVIRMMKTLDYDYLSLGNHDFDYGRERTEELMQIAGFPFGAANIKDLRTGKSIFEKPYIIKEIEGTRIGIVSLGYHNTHLTGNSDNMKDLEFRRGNEVLPEVLSELKEQTDIIVLLSHQGTAVDELTAEEFSDIDLILGGHSHDLFSKKINNTYLEQALSDAAVLGEIELEISDRKLVGVKAQHHFLWLSDYEKDRDMQSLIEDIRAPHRDHLEEKIATATEVIDRQYKSESPFEKLIGNLLREEYNADISLLPGVGYGISLQGEITREDLYRLIPHPPKVATVTLTGEQIKATLEQTATNQKPGDKYEIVGGLLQSSGITYTLDYSKPIGKRISDVQVNGEDLDLKIDYKIITHTGMLKGLHNYTELGNGKNIEKKEIQLNEFAINKFRELGNISGPENMGEVNIIGK